MTASSPSTTTPAAEPALDSPTNAPALAGIHHLKFPVSDLERSLRWYERVLGGVRQPHWDHLRPDGSVFAYILMVPGLPYPLELRDSPGMSARLSGFDPTVFAVDALPDLERWQEHLDAQQVPNSGVLRGIVGWLIVFTDPDGLSLRLYSRQTHEIDHENSDIDSPWVAYPE